MTIVEVESLRAMVKHKDQEVATVRAEMLGRGEHVQSWVEVGYDDEDFVKSCVIFYFIFYLPNLSYSN